MKFYAIVSAPILLSLASIALAEDLTDDEQPATQSSVGLNKTIDSDDNSDIIMDFDWELPGYQHIWAVYSESDSSESHLDTQLIRLGISTDPYKSFSIANEFSYWGKRNNLETRTFRSDLSLTLENWNFTLSPQYSVITFYVDDLPIEAINIESFDVYAIGTEISISYYGWENYFFGINYFENSFGDSPLRYSDPRLRLIVYSRLSISTRSLVTSLEKKHTGVNFGGYFSWGSWAIDLLRSESEIDESEVDSIMLSLDYRFNQRFQFNTAIGTQKLSNQDERINSAQLGARFFW